MFSYYIISHIYYVISQHNKVFITIIGVIILLGFVGVYNTHTRFPIMQDSLNLRRFNILKDVCN